MLSSMVFYHSRPLFYIIATREWHVCYITVHSGWDLLRECSADPIMLNEGACIVISGQYVTSMPQGCSKLNSGEFLMESGS